MPFVVFYIHDGYTQEQKAGVVKDITVAMAKNLGVTEQAVRIILEEQTKDQIGVGGYLESSPEYKALKARAVDIS
jgi:4-oxalocrotonate tautomerase family enzyme